MRSILNRNALLHVRRVRASRQTQVRSMAKSGATYKHTHSYLQILGNGTDTGETLPSVMLFFDAYRYVFNVGEGFQRYCFQHRLKLGKLNDVFLTRMSTEACGGVPGLCITVQESAAQGNSPPGIFDLHGPLKLNQFLSAVQTVVSVPMQGRGWSNFGSLAAAGKLDAPLVSNPQVEIRPILIMPDTEGRGSVLDRSVPAACYVCQLCEIKGKFLPERAKTLGVKMGPDCSKLVTGVSVESRDGHVVHPHQVMEPSIPGPVVLVVDCPDESYASALFSAAGFEAFFREADPKGEMVMVHLGPFEVVSDAAYWKWIEQFPASMQHVFVNERTTHSMAVMRKAAELQTKLHLLDGRYFPLPPTKMPRESWDHEHVILGKDLLRYHLKPIAKKGVDSSQLLPDFDPAAVVRDVESNAEVTASIQKFRRLRERPPEEKSQISPSELELTFLGTGSAIPSKYRNVSGIYLDFFDKGSMLLDCGEGSFGQLIRRFGKAGAQEAIQKLRCVWISHIHADHHMGLPTVLRQRRKLVGPFAEPLLVLGPPALHSTMQYYEKLEPLSFAYLRIHETIDAIPRFKLPRLAKQDSRGMFASVKAMLNLTRMESFLVDHCTHAYGIAIESRAGWKVVYTGDTVPCESVVTNAKDATLLIHEATFEEDMKSEALMKKHSTTQDAIRIAQRANARHTILTHFSQRYPKIPVLDPQAGISVAFDLMCVNLSDLEMLPHIMEPCQVLFRGDAGETEESAALEPSFITA